MEPTGPRAIAIPAAQVHARVWSWSPAISRLRRFPQWLAAIFESERDRWLMWFPVLIGIGVVIYFSLPTEPRLSRGVALVAAAIVLGLSARRRPGLTRLAVAAGLVAAGFLAAELRTAIVSAPRLQRQIGPVLVAGRVSVVELREKGARIIIEDASIAGLQASDTPAEVRLTLTRYSAVPKLGDHLALRAKLFPPPTPAAPGAHDFRRDLFFARIGGVGYAVQKFIAHDGGGAASGGHFLGNLRQAAAERISAVFPDGAHAAERAIALALLVGERGPIPEDVNNAMRNAGLAHLLAISGMNITIAAGLIYFTLRLCFAAIPWIALRFPIKKWAAGGGLIGEVIYTQFVGAPVSAERSMITTGFIMLAIMLDRSSITLRLVAISAMLLILAEPETLMGASFQMSYGAIVALVVLYERWRFHGGAAGSGVARRVLTYLGGIAVMSVVASAASAVFAIYHFQQSAFYGMGANLVAEPIHDLWIMPWGIASYLLMPLHLEFLALKPMGWGISAMLATARMFSTFPGAAGHFEAMPAAALGLIVAGGLWFLLWTRRWRWAGFVPLAAGIALTLIQRQPDILIAEDGKLVAIRTVTGDIALSNRAHDRFTQSVWVRRAGEGDIEEHPPPTIATESERDQCGKNVCRFVIAGHKAAILSDIQGLAVACQDTELVVSPLALDGMCAAPLVIDKAKLAIDGATSVVFDRRGATTSTVRAMSGDRPWSRTAAPP